MGLWRLLKPEPLKNKRANPITNKDSWFLEKDVKSAVEWLKKELSYDFHISQNSTKSMYLSSKRFKEWIIKIDKAFEDVI